MADKDATSNGSMRGVRKFILGSQAAFRGLIGASVIATFLGLAVYMVVQATTGGGTVPTEAMAIFTALSPFAVRVFDYNMPKHADTLPKDEEN